MNKTEAQEKELVRENTPETPLYLVLTRKEVAEIDAKLEQLFQKQSQYLDQHDSALFTKGKKLRPILLILTAKLNAPDLPQDYIDDKIISIATSIEMIHIASLVHDDIIDRAVERRGAATVNRTQGNGFAMLIGDLQFSEAMNLFVNSLQYQKDLKLLKSFLKTGYNLCLGEIEDYLAKPVLDTKLLRQRYYQNIQNKTAELIEFCCEAGGSLANGTKQQIDLMRNFGRNFGLAFQIIDDILDFIGDEDLLGKPTLGDLTQKRISLPMIYALESLPERNLVRDILEGHATSSDDIIEAARLIIHSNGIHKAYDDACLFKERAISALDNYPKSKYKTALEEMLSLVLDQRV